MGSIGSTLNSINTSLLAEIQGVSPNTSTESGTTQSSGSPDKVNFSQVGQLFQQLQQLQSSNPAEFKQVLTDGATQLQAAAAQQTDPNAAAFLNHLASKFQTAASTGDLSALHPQTPDATNSATAVAQGHHHGHHGHHAASATTSSDTDDSDASSTSASTNDLASLFGPLSSSAGGQSSQDLFSLLSGQPDSSSSSQQDLLAAIFSSSTGTNGSNSSQIQSLLTNFIGSNSAGAV